MTNLIKNPILAGFNPDPCIVKAEDTYYIVVSSFEWIPGVRVYESKDLVNWKFTTDILTDQIDLSGEQTACGIWAPQISYHDGIFYLLYTDVKSSIRPFKDTHNYLITAENIHGPWSEPIYLNSSGFDPSLYHDRDGRKWLSNALWDYRMTTPNKSSGIVLQEFDPEKEALVGPIFKIFDMTELAKTEAPHIYFVNDYYYLVMAEGGTGSDHSVTIARSKDITGPYEVDSNYPMMTSSQHPDHPIQCAGHASLIQTDEDEWYMVHLGTRPLKDQRAIMGRETFIQKIKWNDDGWLELAHGGKLPAVEVEPPKIFNGEIKPIDYSFKDDFSSSDLHPQWNSLRMLPNEEWLSLSEVEGKLRLYGGESLHSLYKHHLLAIRQTNFSFSASTQFAFNPNNYLQMAGLILFLNAENYLYAYVSSEDNERVLRIIKADKGEVEVKDTVVPLNSLEGENLFLSVDVDHENAKFFYSESSEEEKRLFFEETDLSFLSGGFTGNFVGIACHDMNRYKGIYADFDYFEYNVTE